MALVYGACLNLGSQGYEPGPAIRPYRMQDLIIVFNYRPRRPSALASDRNQSPNHFHGGQGEQPSPYCKAWGLPVAFGHFQMPTGPGVHRNCCLGALESLCLLNIHLLCPRSG